MNASQALPPVLHHRDLIVFANDWDGDPLSKTHLMRILSKDNRILWVNSLGNRAPKANAHDVRRMWKKVETFAQGIREVEKNIHVLAPLAVPLYGSPAVRLINRQLLQWQIMHAIKTLGMRNHWSWSFLPSSAPVSGTLGEEFVVYHCVDEFSAFADTDGRHIADLEQILLRRADLVITSAERLRASKSKINPNTVLVQHGVDFDHFVKACDPSTQVPEDLAKLPKPVIGFFGLVAEWLDMEAIAAMAKANPKGSVALIGKIAPDADVSRLRLLPNVHFLGRKRYEELPAYCKGFDVAVLPFKNNELTLNANPLKVREYLAAGLPCVATALPETERLGLCYLARTPEDYVRGVEQALRDGAGPSRERAERIRGESWHARVEQIRQHARDLRDARVHGKEQTLRSYVPPRQTEGSSRRRHASKSPS